MSARSASQSSRWWNAKGRCPRRIEQYGEVVRPISEWCTTVKLSHLGLITGDFSNPIAMLAKFFVFLASLGSSERLYINCFAFLAILTHPPFFDGVEDPRMDDCGEVTSLGLSDFYSTAFAFLANSGPSLWREQTILK